jgi:hypothetical protein
MKKTGNFNTCFITLLEMLMEILAEISKGQLYSFLQTMEKSFMKCMGILPLMSCNKTIRKIFPGK